MRQTLRRSGGEAHVSDAGFARVPSGSGDGFRVGVDAIHSCGRPRDPKGETAVATPDVQDALVAHEPVAAPVLQLDLWKRPESRSRGRDVIADIDAGMSRATAHGGCSLQLVGRDSNSRSPGPKPVRRVLGRVCIGPVFPIWYSGAKSVHGHPC